MQARPPSWSERAIRALLVGPVGQAGLPQVGRKPGEAGLPDRPGRILMAFWVPVFCGQAGCASQAPLDRAWA